MKRLGLMAVVLPGRVLNVHADNDVYYNMLKPVRGDALHAGSAICDAQFGTPQNGGVAASNCSNF